ncbi:MAG: TIGR04372 family glycosyltransferase [Elusimicrobia bacterium]|nr:TIGR04372 family glycosyltransferase [Elusimicrobiota bacterium]
MNHTPIRYFMDALSDWIDRKSPVLILTPWQKGLGNLAEEMYYGLLKARRDGKKIIFLYPRPVFGNFPAPVANHELYYLESDYSVSLERNFLGQAFNRALGLIYAVLWLSYLSLRKCLRFLRNRGFVRALPPYNYWYRFAALGRSTLWKPAGIRHFSEEAVKAKEWQQNIAKRFSVRLEERKFQYAQAQRVEMGIPLSDWFVCLHVREGGFWLDSSQRSSSIASYFNGMKVIGAAGGWVVRMGDATMTPLEPTERVIDYPHTPFKSESMDLYLLSQCRFFVGTDSGPLAAAGTFFQRRALWTDLIGYVSAYPLRRGDLGLMKHVFSRSRNRFLSIRELLQEPIESQESSFEPLGADYVLKDNTPEEIREIIEECLSKPPDAPYTELQETFNHIRMSRIQEFVKKRELRRTVSADIEERYRNAAYAYYHGALGQRYLERHWLCNGFNGNNQQFSSEAAAVVTGA